MNQKANPPDTSLPVSELLEIHKVCQQFEAEWKAGRQPKAADFLGDTPEPKRAELKRELESIETEYRQKAKMPTLEVFVETLANSGLMTRAEVQTFLTTLPADARPTDAETLAREMFKQGKLTKFQAQAVFQGKTRGLVVGNYVVLDKLGQGGMGQVYKAQHRKMKRIVALKMLPSAATKSPDAVKRFQREVEAAAKLSHPNIVTAHDADEAGGMYFLVMEYVEGQDLSQTVKQHGPLPVVTAVDYIVQAAKGLEYAHGEGVIHRDIKPANLLADKKGTVKILDMGLARVDGTAGAIDDGLTRGGQVMGTLDYMAPEQAMDTRRADVSADIYGLGCTFHYLLLGRPPFIGETAGQKIVAHREQLIPSLRALRPDVPESLDAVFQKMLAKKPQDRQASMGEVIIQLQSCTLLETAAPAIAQAATGSIAETLNLHQGGIDTSSEQIAADSLVEIAAAARDNRSIVPMPAAKKWLKQPSKRQKVGIGAALGLAFVLVFFGVIFKLRTEEGTLVVEVSDPDATVQVLNGEGKVQIERTGEKGTLTIAVDPGKHRLRVQKNGVDMFAKDFSIASGGTETIKASWQPKVNAPATVANAVAAPDRRAAERVSPSGGAVAAKALREVVVPGVKPGPFVNMRLLVPQSTPIPGTVAWTIETTAPRGLCSAGALSPDEKLFAAAGDDGVIHLIDPRDGTARKIFVNPETDISALAWSPDNTRLVIGTNQGDLRVWNVTDGTPAAVLDRASTAMVTHLAWSPDGTRLCVCRHDSPGEIWDMPDGKRHFALVARADSAYKVFNCAWDPDGKRLATVAFPGETRLWTVNTPGKYTVLPTKDSGQTHIASVAWSPDGKTLALGVHQSPSTLTIWNVDMLKEKMHSPVTTDRCGPLYWSADGRFIVISRWGGGNIFDTHTQRLYSDCPMGLTRYGDRPVGLGWIRGTNEFVAVANRSGWARLRFHPERARDQLPSEVVWRVPAPCGTEVNPHWLSLSDDGKTLSAVASDSVPAVVCSWDTGSGLQRHVPKQLKIYAGDIEHISSGALLIAGRDGVVVLDPASGEVATQAPEPARGWSANWSPVTSTLALGTNDSVIAWTPPPSNAILKLCKAAKPVESVSYSPDGTHVAVGEQNGDVSLLDVKSQYASHGKPPNELPVRGLLWITDSRVLAIQQDGTACIYDSRVDNRYVESFSLGVNCFQAALLPGTNVALVASDSGAVLCDLSARHLLARLGDSPCRAIAVSRDGNLAASMHFDRLVLWDTRTWQPLRTFVAEPDGTYFSVTAGGACIGSTGLEKLIRYVLLDARGRQTTLTSAEFKAHYGTIPMQPTIKHDRASND